MDGWMDGWMRMEMGRGCIEEGQSAARGLTGRVIYFFSLTFFYIFLFFRYLFPIYVSTYIFLPLSFLF
jgi:hypothetical protein